MMKKKKIKLTIWADPDTGFLQRVLLVFSRRKMPLNKFCFEGPDLRQELYCQLELETTEDSIEKTTKQIANILGVKNVIFEIIESGSFASYQYQAVKEKDFSIIN